MKKRQDLTNITALIAIASIIAETLFQEGWKTSSLLPKRKNRLL
jgi:hypothetical protein